MGKHHQKLIDDREWYKQRSEQLDAENVTLRKRVAALKGWLKRKGNSK